MTTTLEKALAHARFKAHAEADVGSAHEVGRAAPQGDKRQNWLNS